ncbi:MAG: hypothetical protein GAK28_03019 [Luteibacter sp.]|uniref:carboxypeptidase-like regulatory domain-containing protein n=1 Tax=Luteibacter sp. TaxID=1886636 RepID=UPI001384DE62|nr:carboxypeptidase-like regulatory domain-containing protein [Luteibacter sp.]KAF1005798.1 MAG: hypothetical protein GAK28_03019 [Luteibacter sp.]
MPLRTLAFLALLPFASVATDAPQGTLDGHAAPNTQVVVIADGGAMVGVMSDDHGHFIVKDLAPGQYDVATKGDERHARGAPIIAGRTTTIDLTSP